LLQLFGYLNLLNLDFSILGISCFTQVDFYTMYAYRTSLLLTWIVLTLCAGIFSLIRMRLGRWLASFRKDTKKSSEPVTTETVARKTTWYWMPFSQVINATILTAQLAYTGLLYHSLTFLSCTRKQNGAHYLTQNETLLCYSPEWWIHFPLALISLGFVILIPLSLCLSLWIRKRKNTMLVNSFLSNLVNAYRANRVFASLVPFVRKTMIVIVFALYGLTPSATMLVVLTISIIFMGLQSVANFYTVRPLSSVDTAGTWVVMMTLLIGVILFAQTTVYEAFQYTSLILQVIEFALLALFGGVWITCIIWIIIIPIRERMKQKKAQKARTAEVDTIVLQVLEERKAQRIAAAREKIQRRRERIRKEEFSDLSEASPSQPRPTVNPLPLAPIPESVRQANANPTMDSVRLPGAAIASLQKWKGKALGRIRVADVEDSD
jgi:hypothetical protein